MRDQVHTKSNLRTKSHAIHAILIDARGLDLGAHWSKLLMIGKQGERLMRALLSGLSAVVCPIAALVMAVILLDGGPVVAQAQEGERRAVSQCQAIAERLPAVRYASFMPDANERLAWPLSTMRARMAPHGDDRAVTLAQGLSRAEVRITYVGHSTYLIETAGGVSIATDFNGYAGPVLVPTIVTMNKAHSSHYTNFPDPAIQYVLPGWNPDGGPADHDVVVSDVYVRNVTTDIRSGYNSMEADANSIFIFEVAGLCIGHLGHLHHMLENEHYAEIGRLDIVMVPVDGGLTMSAERMGQVVSRLRSSIILPMHRFRVSINDFLSRFGDDYATEFSSERSFTVSLRSLPDRPTILILQGV